MRPAFAGTVSVCCGSAPPLAVPPLVHGVCWRLARNRGDDWVREVQIKNVKIRWGGKKESCSVAQWGHSVYNN